MPRKQYNFYIYILTSATGTLYIGITNDLARRIAEHKSGDVSGFSKKYSCNKLVYYEHCENVYAAIEREKQLKKWRREKKQNLIKTINPHWNDLSNKMF